MKALIKKEETNIEYQINSKHGDILLTVFGIKNMFTFNSFPTICNNT